MALCDAEFAAILGDRSKTITDDLAWAEDQDHSPAVEFQAEIESTEGYPLVVYANFNPLAQRLSFVIIHRQVGRVYALDMGQDHRNPDGELVGDLHKHRWTEQFGDRQAYRPNDITEALMEPGKVWRQFCAEARIVHDGTLSAPPSRQMEIPL